MNAANRPEMDEQTLEFANQVIDLARQGDTERLANLLSQGLPANLRNHKGDSLLMLASYYGHHDTAAVLLEHAPTRTCATMQARHRWPAPLSRAIWRWSACCSAAAPRWKAPRPTARPR